MLAQGVHLNPLNYTWRRPCAMLHHVSKPSINKTHQIKPSRQNNQDTETHQIKPMKPTKSDPHHHHVSCPHPPIQTHKPPEHNQETTKNITRHRRERKERTENIEVREEREEKRELRLR